MCIGWFAAKVTAAVPFDCEHSSLGDCAALFHCALDDPKPAGRILIFFIQKGAHIEHRQEATAVFANQNAHLTMGWPTAAASQAPGSPRGKINPSAVIATVAADSAC